MLQTLILTLLFIVADRAFAEDTPAECPSWTGTLLVECQLLPDGSVLRSREIDARVVYQTLAGSGVELTSQIGKVLLEIGSVPVAGSAQVSFFFPYTKKQTTATLSLEEREKRRFVAVRNVRTEEHVDMVATVILVCVPLLCAPFAYVSRLLTSRINPPLARKLGYVFLVLLIAFLADFSSRVFAVTGLSKELLYFALCIAVTGIAWILGRMHARSRRIKLDVYGRPISLR